MKACDNILEIDDLCVEVGGKMLLDHLNLTVPYGEVHALLGQNGSGKTSLMMTIMGFSDYEVTQGRIIFKGQDITKLDVSRRSRLGIAVAQQRPPTIPGVTLRNLLAYILRDAQDTKKKISELAEGARMESFLDRNINDGLSGGEIKRAEILQLLALSPDFSMLDEPDSGVDIEALTLVGKLVNKLFSTDEAHPVKRKAGLITTHSGDVLSHLHIDKAHVLHNGYIGCSGNPAMVMETINKLGYGECVRCIEGRSDK